MNTTHLIIVVPCYNEESVLPETIRQLSGVLNRMLENGKISIGKILFVPGFGKDKGRTEDLRIFEKKYKNK